MDTIAEIRRRYHDTTDRRQMLGAEMDMHDGLDTAALEQALLGIAVPDIACTLRAG